MRLPITFIAGVSLLACGASANAQTLPQADDAYYSSAQSELIRKLSRRPIERRAKNVILMVSDGNGVGSNYATRLFWGQKEGGLGDDAVLPHENLPYLGLVKTYNHNAQTPDSAGTATAMNSGVKTKIGVIGVKKELTRGDCSTVEANKVKNFANMMAENGKSVGIVSTARITHATPAAVYAHAADRNFEDNSGLPEGCSVLDIAAQLVEVMKSGTVDLAMGGGRRHFITKETTDQEGKTGKRTDGRNLIDEAKAAGAQYAWDDASFAALALDGKTPVLGLFESSHMKYEHDRTGEPSLAEMTEAAINYLSQNEDGFYLAIEAGRVDHANHDGNAHRMITDGVAFAEAVAKAMQMTDPEETLIIVTADHEHAIAFNGYCGRGSPITGLCYDVDPAGTAHNGEPLTGEDGKPYTVIGYLNGAGTILQPAQGDVGEWSGTRAELSNEEAMDPDYIQQALIPLSSETHSGEDVAVYARGPWAHLFDGTIEQQYIFHVMKHATGL